jgi:hypothetical protein
MAIASPSKGRCWELSRTWLKCYFWLSIYVFKYLFKENVFIFELCVMGLRPHGAVMRVLAVA